MAFLDKKWFCPLCDYRAFTTNSVLQQHNQQHHNGTGIDDFHDVCISHFSSSDEASSSMVLFDSSIGTSPDATMSPRSSSNGDGSERSSAYMEESRHYDYFMQFMQWNARNSGSSNPIHDTDAQQYSEPVLVSLRFLQALETGDSLSMSRQQTLLTNAISMGGTALLMNPDIRKHWDYVEAKHATISKARGLRRTSFDVPLEVQLLLGRNPPSKIPFACEDIVLVMMRLLLLNPYNKEENLQFSYEESSYYDDYCTGSRWKRVMDDLSKGKYALFFTLFIDSLIQDKGGFVSAKGCVLTMANYRWHLRGASCSKAGICTFPEVVVPKTNAGKRIVVQWKKQLFHDCIAFMLLPVHEFNARGGVMVSMHDTGYHFQRMILLALITDAPEARDLGGTISGCHHCFCPKHKQGDVTASYPSRTALNIAEKTAKYRSIIAARVKGTVQNARDEAKKEGINPELQNGFLNPGWCRHSIFGPNPLYDHVHGALPQGMLHGLHEGLIKYNVKAVIEVAVASAIRRDVHGLKGKWTSISKKKDGSKKKDPRLGNRKFVLDYIDDALRNFHLENARCSDVELTCSIGKWEYFPNDVTEGLVGAKTKRLNGMCYWTMLRQVHLAVCASNYLTRDEKVQVSGMCQLGYEVTEIIHNPVKKDGNDAEDFQVMASEYVRQLIVLWKPFSKSNCESIKWHLVHHWLWYLRQMGAFSDERTLEKELGILFKKPYKLTNHREGYSDQMAIRTQQKAWLLELCAHAGVGDTLLQAWSGVPDITAANKKPGETAMKGPSIVLQRMSYVDEEALYKDFEYANTVAILKDLLREENIPFPVKVGSQLKMSIRNRCLPQTCVGHYQPVTFRAKANFHGSPWYDTMRYLYKMGEGDAEIEGIGYGRCVCFLTDAVGQHYALLRSYAWYDDEPAVQTKGKKKQKRNVEILDPLLQMVPFYLTAKEDTRSYVLARTDAIINGGLMLADPLAKGKYWAVQSARELSVLMTRNVQ